MRNRRKTSAHFASAPSLAGIIVGLGVVVGGVAPGSQPGGSETTGLVELAPSEVRADFAAGIVALHDFWYEEAERRFRAVQRAAPGFTLGYWGEAMALHRNPFGFSEPPVDSMRAILGRLAPTAPSRAAAAGTEHERGYLAALEVLIADGDTPALRHPAYVDAMASLAADYPDDLEALAFHARSILLEAPSFGHARETQARTAAAALRVIELDPDHHGGLHYYIHGMDTPQTAAAALDAAERYQALAVGASHAVHMPSHIYLQLGMWDRVVQGNQEALRTSLAAIQRSGGSLGGLDRHALDFQFYALLQQGREREARARLEEARAHRAEFDTPTIRWYEARWSARYASELGARSEIDHSRSGYGAVVEPLGFGLQALAKGDRGLARGYLAEIRERVESGSQVEWRIAALELEAALDGGPDAARLLREAIELQAEMPRPNETPDLPKPPEELLGEILLASDDAAGALAAFEEAEARWASRLATGLGRSRALAALGHEDRAREAYAALLRQLRHTTATHPARAEAREYLESTGGVPAATLAELSPGRAPATLPEVEQVGTGPRNVVIIPCMSCRWRSFDTFMERNADRYTMYAVTLPGFGGTPIPDVPLDSGRAIWYPNAVEAVAALIEREDLEDVVLLGHSYGAVVAVGVAERMPGRVGALINIDGNFVSDRGWFSDDPSERPAAAAEVVRDYGAQFHDAENWRRFNASSRDDAARRALYHGMFMATPPQVLLQYWQENLLFDLNPMVAGLEIPILDLKTLPRASSTADSIAQAWLDELHRNGAPESVHTVFLGGTSHYVMEHRPQVLDGLISDWLAGEEVGDFDPAASGHPGAEDVARVWVSALARTLREDVDSSAVARLLELYHEDAVYQHPRADARIEGREAIRTGITRFLGSTRQPRVDLRALVAAGDDVVLTIGLVMEARHGSSWVPVRRTQSVVLRVREGRIAQITEYW